MTEHAASAALAGAARRLSAELLQFSGLGCDFDGATFNHASDKVTFEVVAALATFDAAHAVMQEPHER